ncbi:MAG TPA: hypothetical protein PLP64_02155 [Pseudothermotoga sp.]|nr:hypothetical protein [Pseudothermotoga sp.]HOK83009.1 hypothetical protein [Pseudothermotoga sp.]HPP69822.1 hypothetical protein [Pseudothermotoga sp.]
MRKIIPIILISFLIISCAMLDTVPPVLEVSVSKVAEVANDSIVLNVTATDQNGKEMTILQK